VKFDYLQTPSGKEHYRLNSQKRRHHDHTTQTLSKKELDFLRRFQPKCVKCGRTGKLTIDHHIPLSKGGILALDNVVLLCSPCNSKKFTKLPEEFYSQEELAAIEQKFSLIQEQIQIGNLKFKKI